MTKQLKTLGEDIWKRTEKINGELFVLTYGAFVAQLLKDYEDAAQVNSILEKTGYSMGMRLIEDILAKSQLSRCTDFKETAEVISKVGFKMFLNITPVVANWSADGKEFSLLLEENPLTEYVELPESVAKTLYFSNVLCGVLRGCLEMVQMQTEVWFVSDILKGDEATEMRVKLVKIIEDEVPTGDY